jgi:hypothetical protein
MKVELKSVKIYDKLSEETICFTATFYIDGKKAGEVENRGHGGCTCYRFFNSVDEANFEAYVNSLPPKIIGHEQNMKAWSKKMSGDDLFDDLLNAHIKAKEEKKLTKLDAK